MSGTQAAMKRDGETFVESFEKGLRVICAFDAAHPAMTLSEVAVRTGLTRAAARRLLLTLLELGFAEQEARTFRLTAKVLSLGYAYLSASGWPGLVLPYLERVSAALGESSSVAVLDGADVVYVARKQTKRIMSADVGVGTRLPAVFTSIGRVLLAFHPRSEALLASSVLVRRTERSITSKARLRAVLEEVRARGYALVDQELEEGLRSIAVPLADRHGRVIAAINVSGQANRVTVEEMKRVFLPVLKQAAVDLRQILG